MRLVDFLMHLREGMEAAIARGQADDSKVIARFWAPDDEFMGPRFRPNLLEENQGDLNRYGVTMFQARLCLSMLGVPSPPTGGWD